MNAGVVGGSNPNNGNDLMPHGYQNDLIPVLVVRKKSYLKWIENFF